MLDMYLSNFIIITSYFFMQALKFHVACDMTAQEVHDLGQKEVKRIRSRMDEVSASGKANLENYFKYIIVTCLAMQRIRLS